MTDSKNPSSKDSPSKDNGRAGDSSPVRRPYATLDLKATEIKVTSLGDKAPSSSGKAPVEPAGKSTIDTVAQGMSAAASANTVGTPRPAAAATYGTRVTEQSAKINMPNKEFATAQSSRPEGNPAGKTESNAQPAKADAATPSASGSGQGASSTPRSAASQSRETATVIVKKRGGFFTHLAASIVGGVLAVAAAAYALPRLGLPGLSTQLADGAAAIEKRLAQIEKKNVSVEFKDVSAQLTDKLHAAEERVVALEKSVNIIPALKEAQARLVAETKAALASSAKDTGATEQLLRLSALEEKMKALAETGANDPNAGRVAQLAALTGKVSDLETSLSTQLTSLRKSVTEDVDARIASVSASSEAAKSGTQRIDQDLAAMKTDTVRLAERLIAMKTESDKLSENLKIAQEENATLKAALETLRGATAKPQDVALAVAPVTQKLASIEQTVQTVLKAEEDRRTNAERIVLSLELQNLKRVLDRGQKYDSELAEVQKAAGNKVDLSALNKFKEQGVPTLPDLTREFRAAANAAVDAEADAGDGSVVGRLIAGAKSVVRVRKVSHNPDDKSTEAIVGRMEAALKDGELGDLLEQSKALPDKAKAAATPFLEKVAARHNVDAAVATLEGQLKTSLSAAPAAAPKSVQ